MKPNVRFIGLYTVDDARRVFKEHYPANLEI